MSETTEFTPQELSEAVDEHEAAVWINGIASVENTANTVYLHLRLAAEHPALARRMYETLQRGIIDVGRELGADVTKRTPLDDANEAVEAFVAAWRENETPERAEQLAARRRKNAAIRALDAVKAIVALLRDGALTPAEEGPTVIPMPESKPGLLN